MIKRPLSFQNSDTSHVPRLPLDNVISSLPKETSMEPMQPQLSRLVALRPNKSLSAERTNNVSYTTVRDMNIPNILRTTPHPA